LEERGRMGAGDCLCEELHGALSSTDPRDPTASFALRTVNVYGA
jgi:hypothetical protein